MLMMEYEGDIFVMFISCNKNLLMFKLNFKCNVWEEKREFGGLIVFVSYFIFFIRVGFLVKERNRIYLLYNGYFGVYYFFGDGIISFCFFMSNYLFNCIVWVDFFYNNFNL